MGKLCLLANKENCRCSSLMFVLSQPVHHQTSHSLAWLRFIRARAGTSYAPPPPNTHTDVSKTHTHTLCVSSLWSGFPRQGKRGFGGREEKRQCGCDTTMTGSCFRSIRISPKHNTREGNKHPCRRDKQVSAHVHADIHRVQQRAHVRTVLVPPGSSRETEQTEL